MAQDRRDKQELQEPAAVLSAPASAHTAERSSGASAEPGVRPAPDGGEETNRTCLNCGTPLQGHYCGACGQSANVRIPTLRDIVGEFLDGFFNLDSRIWATLVPLVTRPGFLTNEYLAGRRARYLPPFRLYLILSLIYFVVASVTNGADENRGVSVDPDRQSSPEESCAWVRNVIPEANRLSDPTYRACTRIVADGGAAFNREFPDRIPLMFFVMIPLFAMGVKLVYPFSGRMYAEHLFFLFHLHAFSFLAATVGAVVTAISGALSPGSGIPVLLLTPLWLYVLYYPYRALRRVYGQGSVVTLLKYGILGAGYLGLLSLTFLAVFVFTAFTL